MTHQIVTANRLIDGAVVYFTVDDTWSPSIAEGRIMDDEQTTDTVLELARVSVARNEVIDPYQIDVDLEASAIKPLRYREAIRAKGPSTHPAEDVMPLAQVSLKDSHVGAVAA